MLNGLSKALLPVLCFSLGITCVEASTAEIAAAVHPVDDSHTARFAFAEPSTGSVPSAAADRDTTASTAANPIPSSVAARAIAASTSGIGVTSAAAAQAVAGSAAPIAVLGIREPASGFAALRADSTRNFDVPFTARPGYFAPDTDVTFGTRVIRIAGDEGSAIGGGVSGTWGSDVRHHYSKDQPWNADGSLLAVQNNGGGLILLDGETYEPRRGRCPSYSMGDDRWHPSLEHANERISVRGTELIWYDVVRCVKTRSWVLPFAVQWFGPSEGNPSKDGRFAAVTDGTRMFVVDMDPQAPLAPYPASRIGPVTDIGACGLTGGCSVDWVSISPSGKYVVVNYDGDHSRVYDVNPATLSLTPRSMPAGSPRCSGTAEAGFIYDLGHADMTLNPFDGDEDVLIGQESCDLRGRTVDGKVMSAVVMVRLSDGAVTPLTHPENEAQAHHVSTRNDGRPGWTYVGYHAAPGKRFTDEIVAVKLDGSGTVQRLAHKHSAYDNCYRCESHAVPSRDGRRVLWASNWASNCASCGPPTDVKPYIVDVRASARSGLIPVAPYAIVADASRSTRVGGRITSYTFEFGDGQITGPQTSPFAPHTYTSGRWNMKVTVTDNLGVSATSTRSLEVESSVGNQPPMAALSMTPASGTAPLATVADASASSDPEGSIVSYRFDFGDGTVETQPTPVLSHIYAPGTWTATVLVTDASGAQSFATAQVIAATPPPPDTLTTNLVGNPSFETHLNGWKGYSGGSLKRVTGGVDGTSCLAVTGSSLGSVFGVNDSPNWIGKVPANGTRYHISAWVRAMGLLGSVRIQVREWNNGSQVGKTVLSAPVRAGLWWEEVSVDVTARQSGSSIDVQVIDAPLIAPETFYLDNVSIRVIPPRAGAEFAASHGEAVNAIDSPPRVSSNPMFARGTIELSTSRPGPLRASLFDVSGRVVRVLADHAFAPAGTQRLEIDGHDHAGRSLAAGVYFYSVHSSAGRANGRIVLVR